MKNKITCHIWKKKTGEKCFFNNKNLKMVTSFNLEPHLVFSTYDGRRVSVIIYCLNNIKLLFGELKMSRRQKYMVLIK